ncbi:hypothetical protein ACCD10_16155 [Pseudomonas sp. Pseusp122]|uniref:hypothetical protein n=1 Tax=unclassified Pseudomonas TaxID=196821 RepID=UPI0039A44D24
MTELNKPKIVQVKDVEGQKHTFIISRLPAVAGREILAKYPVSNIPSWVSTATAQTPPNTSGRPAGPNRSP